MLNYYKAAQIASEGVNVARSRDAVASIADDSLELTIDVPTMVIWGEEDKALTIENLNGLDRYVKDLKVTRLPATSHWVLQEKPDEVNNLIDSFVALRT